MDSRLKLIVEAIGLGGLDTSITEGDVSFTLSEKRIEEILINPEVSLHDGKPWNNAKYFRDATSVDVIAGMSFTKFEVDSNIDSGDKVLVINVGVLENRSEYRKTKVFEYIMMYFLEYVVKPSVEKHGKNKVFLNASFANEKLGRVVRKFFDRSTEGAKWISDMPDRYYGNEDSYDEEEDEDSSYEYDEEDWGSSEEDEEESFFDFLTHEYGLSNMIEFDVKILIPNLDDMKKFLEKSEDYGGSNLGIGIFADGTIQGTIWKPDGSTNMYGDPVEYPDNSFIKINVYPEGAGFSPETIQNIPQLGDKIESVMDRLISTFESITNEVKFNGETLTWKQIKDKVMQQDAPSTELTAKRLIKKKNN